MLGDSKLITPRPTPRQDHPTRSSAFVFRTHFHDTDNDGWEHGPTAGQVRDNYWRRTLMVPLADISISSFDHLVGAGEQRLWHVNSQRLGSLHIDDQCEMGWLFDR
jgi:hypothetical protein